MLNRMKGWSLTVAGGIPPLVVCGILAGVAYWGDRTQWKAEKFSVLFPKLAESLGLQARGTADEAKADDKRTRGTGHGEVRRAGGLV